MVPENAVKRFLREVWEKSQRDGWPVNASDIDVFGDDKQVAKKSLQNVVAQCQNLGYLKPTLEGDIHSISDSAKELIGVE